MNGLARDIGYCLAFFTRLPLPKLDLAGRTLAGAIWAAPVAGLAVALVAGAVFWAAQACGLSGNAAAALTLAASMLATGCLHEDGLSDVADGFGGGATRERKLEIMRDSRIGAYGACAIGAILLMRWSALAELSTPAHAFVALVAAHAASRAMLPAFMAMTPQARRDGLAASAGSVEPGVALVAALLGLVALLCLGFAAALAAAAVLALLLVVFRVLCMRQIGGHSGDTLGALQQLAEAAILLTASAFLF